MTLSMALLTSQFVTVVTDRRLTSGGRVQTEESDKTFALFTGDARVAVSFSGLASGRTFKTHQWLLSATYDAAPPDYSISGLLVRLRDRLTAEFSSNAEIRGMPAVSRRLSVMVAGYMYSNPPCAIYGIISNWQNSKTGVDLPEASDEFHFYTGQANFPVTIGVGNLNGLTARGMTALRSVAEDVGPRAATLRLVAEMRRAASHDRSYGLVGKQLTSILVCADPAEPISTDYHVAAVRRGAVMPACVFARPDQHMAIRDIRIRPVESDTPDMSVPRVGRNKPCPCQSGKKYKLCHGR